MNMQNWRKWKKTEKDIKSRKRKSQSWWVCFGSWEIDIIIIFWKITQFKHKVIIKLKDYIDQLVYQQIEYALRGNFFLFFSFFILFSFSTNFSF